MQSTNRKHKILRRVAGFTGGLVVLFLCFHFWFVNHAEELIENLVNSQSNGRLELKVQKFKFNWFSRKFELRKVSFTSTDSTGSPNSYQLDVERIRIQVKALWPLITEKKFLIDSLQVITPVITITRLRSLKDSTSDNTVSLPQEMGRVYRSIQDALSVLQVDRFTIDNGTFSLVNNMRPEDHPIRISRIYFKLDNLSVDSSADRSQQKILFSDNVSLNTSYQDILFPDGRHKLSFRNFRVNVKNKLAEFDSCTISATRGDSSNNNFQIFFDKLLMTNIDFDTLYHSEVIKADSVYCINPRFKLDIDLQKRQGPLKPPKVDELIQQMTGDMQLAFVIVQNGSFDINTVRDGRPSSFTSDHNNFDLQGFRINHNANQPVMIDRFSMAIRNYENFLRDSTYSIRFDSILINNNRIKLGNFAYQEFKNRKVINSVMVPQFELHGLSWDALISDQQLMADRVNLYSPVINYTILPNKSKPVQDVFQTLAEVGNIIRLRELHIRNGKINLEFKNNTRLNLENAYLSVKAETLVNSTKISTIQRSVNELYFRYGTFTSGALVARLSDARFSKGGQGLTADHVHVANGRDLMINAMNVGIRQVLIDEKNKQNHVSGISWASAEINIDGQSGGGPARTTDFDLSSVNVNNTTLSVKDSIKTITVFLQTAMADEIRTADGKLSFINGIQTTGKNLQFSKTNQLLTVPVFRIIDMKPSTLGGLAFTNFSNGDSVNINAPLVMLVPDFNSFLRGTIRSSAVVIDKPTLRIFQLFKESSGEEPASLPVIDLDSVTLIDPVVDFNKQGGKGFSTLKWTGNNGNNSIALKKLKTFQGADNYVSLDELNISADQFIYSDARGKTFNAGKGHINATVKNIAIHRNEMEAWDWEGTVKELTAVNFNLDSFGKKRGLLDLKNARLNDISISSGNLLNLRELAAQNTEFRITGLTGSFDDSLAHYDWLNLAYDKRSRILSVDTFNFHPIATNEQFRKRLVYQSDYITIKTGPVSIGPFDIERYIRDTVLDMGVASIKNGYMFASRDKRIPRKPGVITPLPTNMIKNLPVRLVVDSVILENAAVDYQETNDKNGLTGDVSVTNLNGVVSHMINYGLTPADSLVIHASAFVANALPTNLDVHASYLDTFGGFVMTLQIGKSDLTKLNPVLRPLASAELRSGIIDTLSMDVMGREYYAFGNMTMYYHGLKIRVVRDGTQKKTFFTSILSFLVNAIIRNENDSRKSVVYFKRLRDRSAINYLVKTTMDGVITSIGLKRNRKQIKEYKKEAKKMGIPLFPADFK
ncbi:MAG: hypothetical protein ABWZ25_10145 [Chitinophagaceae bacterium]